MGYFREEYDEIHQQYENKLRDAAKEEDKIKRAEMKEAAERWYKSELIKFTPWFNLNSSFLHACRYRFEEPTLEVLINREYIYRVSLSRADGLTTAKSPGRYYDRCIKGVLSKSGGEAIAPSISTTPASMVSYIDAGKRLNLPTNIKKPVGDILKQGILPADITRVINSVAQSGTVPTGTNVPTYISKIIEALAKEGITPKTQPKDTSIIGQIFSPVKIALFFAPQAISGPVSIILAVANIVTNLNKLAQEVQDSNRKAPKYYI